MNLDIILDNLVYFLAGPLPHGPVGGAALTLFLTVVSAFISGLLGLVFGVLLFVSRGPVRIGLRLALDLFRAVPVLMLIFWIYFLGPIAFGLDVPGVGAVVAALSLIGGAYLAHTVHAGLAALAPGQWAAAAALGLSPRQAMVEVAAPQVLPRLAPSIVNQWVALTKDTSLAYVIGVADLSFVATQVSNRVIVHPVEIYLFVAALYFLLCASLELAAGQLARRRRSPAI